MWKASPSTLLQDYHVKSRPEHDGGSMSSQNPDQQPGSDQPEPPDDPAPPQPQAPEPGEQGPSQDRRSWPFDAILRRISLDTWVQIGAGLVISFVAFLAGWLFQAAFVVQQLDKAIWAMYGAAAVLIIAALRNRLAPARLTVLTLGLVIGLAGALLQTQRPWCEEGTLRILVVGDDDGAPIAMVDGNSDPIRPGRRLLLRAYIAPQVLDDPPRPLSAVCRWAERGDGYFLLEGGRCAVRYQMGDDETLDELELTVTRPSCTGQAPEFVTHYLHPLGAS